MPINKPHETGWRPSASVETLKKRAHLLKDLRAYMDRMGIMEADVPALGQATVTDPFIQSLSLQDGQETFFLQTSPEYYLKRMLAAGFGDVYYLGPAFRKDERGKKHRSEFTMLEWYRLGQDDHSLMKEMACMFRQLKPSVAIQFLTYQDAFQKALCICPHNANLEELRTLAYEKAQAQFESPLKSVWLDVLFSHCVEPDLPEGVAFVFDFPECMSALAKLDTNEHGQKIARRFECYWNGVELANGYWELTDAEEQARRFENDNALRRELGLHEVESDPLFLEALREGLPDCAGVAMGVDRLLMCLENSEDIAKTMAFSDH